MLKWILVVVTRPIVYLGIAWAIAKYSFIAGERRFENWCAKRVNA